MAGDVCDFNESVETGKTVYTYNDIIEKSIVIYEDFERQKWRIDYNNHGYSNHSISYLHERD